MAEGEKVRRSCFRLLRVPVLKGPAVSTVNAIATHVGAEDYASSLASGAYRFSIQNRLAAVTCKDHATAEKFN